MEKNTGKTTLLNSIIRAYSDKRTLALTSIGYDGEDTDQVTNTHKPRIFIPSGTLVATARSLLTKCDCVKEIIKVLNIRTAIGEIVLFRAKSDGYIELGGPSIIEDLKKLKVEISAIDANAQFIVDGALSRKSMAGHHLCDASILCTGAAYSASMKTVVEATASTIAQLKLKTYQDISIEKLETMFNSANSVLVTNDNQLLIYDENHTPPTPFKAIALKGLVTNKRIKKLMQYNDFENIDIICEDGTRLFIEKTNMRLIKKKNIGIYVMHPIDLMAVALNPSAPSGNNFDATEFKNAIASICDLPIIDTRSLNGI